VTAAVLSGGQPVLRDEIVIAGKCAWNVCGPVRVAAGSESLDAPAPAEGWRPILTDGHALVLDDGLEFDRAYFVRVNLRNPKPGPGRIVCATPQLQCVWLDGVPIIRKEAATPFVPAPHRSGAGTVHAMEQLPENLPLDITLVVAAGERAEVHLFLTVPSGPEYLDRNCPIVGVVHEAR